jgi:hypothetical protein
MSYPGPKQLWDDLMFIWTNNKNKDSIFFDNLVISSLDNYFELIVDSSIQQNTFVERYRDHEFTLMIEKNLNFVKMWEGKLTAPEFRIVSHLWGSQITEDTALRFSHEVLCPVIRELKLLELGI